MPPRLPANATIHWTHPITPSQVHRLILAEPNATKALLIFDAATAEYPSGFRHDVATFSLLAARLAAAGHPRRAETLLSRAASELPAPLPESSFLPVLRSHPPLASLELLHSLKSLYNVDPTHRSFNAVLANLVSDNHLQLARKLYNRMKELGVEPTITTYNVILKALCSAGSVDTAMRLFSRLPERGLVPDVCTYNTVIDGLCKVGRVDDASEMFGEMREKGCSPSVVTYTSLIHGLCSSGKLDGALEVFDEMVERSVAPNVVTYCALVDGLVKGGRALHAMELVEQMGKAKCKPNMRTYSALVHGLSKEGRMQEAMEVLDRMRLHGRKPDAGLYGKIVNGLCDSSRFREAANYLDEMALGGVLPNRVTWSLHIRMHNKVVRGLCEAGDRSRAVQVHRSMRTRAISTEPETFAVLVNCLCEKGDVNKAAGIVDEMFIDGCVPDEVIWSSIVGGYWGRRKTQEMAELLVGDCLGYREVKL